VQESVTRDLESVTRDLRSLQDTVASHTKDASAVNASQVCMSCKHDEPPVPMDRWADVCCLCVFSDGMMCLWQMTLTERLGAVELLATNSSEFVTSLKSSVVGAPRNRLHLPYL
jgi:hypothetical protein